MAITIHLTDDQVVGIQELVFMAQRGREDYLNTLRTEQDYTEADQTANETRWNAAQSVIRAISYQAAPGQVPVIDILATFLGLARDWTFGTMWESAQCTEAEAAAELYRALGQYDAAEDLLTAHAYADVDEDDQHHYRYIELKK